MIEFQLDNKKTAEEILQKFNQSTNVIPNRYLHVELVDFQMIIIKCSLLKKLKAKLIQFNEEFVNEFHCKGPYKSWSNKDPMFLRKVKQSCPELKIPEQALEGRKDSDTLMLRIEIKDNPSLNAKFISQISKFVSGEDILIHDSCAREMFGDEGKALISVLTKEHEEHGIFIDQIPFKSIWRVHAFPVILAEIKKSIEDKMAELQTEETVNFRYTLTGQETTILLSNQSNPSSVKSSSLETKDSSSKKSNDKNFDLLSKAVTSKDNFGQVRIEMKRGTFDTELMIQCEKIHQKSIKQFIGKEIGDMVTEWTKSQSPDSSFVVNSQDNSISISGIKRSILTEGISDKSVVMNANAESNLDPGYYSKYADRYSKSELVDTLQCLDCTGRDNLRMLINCGHVLCFKCLNSHIINALSNLTQNQSEKLLESSICCIENGCKTPINVHEIFDTILESRAANIISQNAKELVRKGVFSGKYICQGPKCDEFVAETKPGQEKLYCTICCEMFPTCSNQEE